MIFQKHRGAAKNPCHKDRCSKAPQAKSSLMVVFEASEALDFPRSMSD